MVAIYLCLGFLITSSLSRKHWVKLLVSDSGQHSSLFVKDVM